MKTSIHKLLALRLFARSRRRSKVKRVAACAALALATAWSSPAEAAVIHVEVSPTQTVTQAVLVYYHKNTSDGTPLALGTLPGGQTSIFDLTVPEPIEAFDPSPPFPNRAHPAYGIAGLYTQNDVTGMSVGFLDTSPIADGKTWDNLVDEVGRGLHEASVISLWPNFSVGLINSFEQLCMAPFGTQVTMINFSTASFGGTALVTVPEPSSVVLLVTAAGILGAMGFRRHVRTNTRG